MTAVKEVSKKGTVQPSSVVDKTEFGRPPAFARVDKVEKASNEPLLVETNPASDPLASSPRANSFKDDVPYMSPIAWLVAISINAMKVNSDLAKAFGDNFTLMINTVRKEANTVGEMIKTDLTEQSKAAKAAAAWGFTGAAISFGGAAAGGIGGARSKGQLKRLGDKTQKAKIKAASGTTVGTPTGAPAGPAAAGARAPAGRPGQRLQTNASSDRTAAPTKRTRAERLADQKHQSRLEEIKTSQSTVAGVSQSLAQGGGALGNAGSSAFQVEANLKRAEAGEKQQKAEGEKQIASSILQMAAEAKSEATKVMDGILGLVNQMASAFSNALRG